MKVNGMRMRKLHYLAVALVVALIPLMGGAACEKEHDATWFLPTPGGHALSRSTEVDSEEMFILTEQVEDGLGNVILKDIRMWCYFPGHVLIQSGDLFYVFDEKEKALHECGSDRESALAEASRITGEKPTSIWWKNTKFSKIFDLEWALLESNTAKEWAKSAFNLMDDQEKMQVRAALNCRPNATKQYYAVAQMKHYAHAFGFDPAIDSMVIAGQYDEIASRRRIDAKIALIEQGGKDVDAYVARVIRWCSSDESKQYDDVVQGLKISYFIGLVVAENVLDVYLEKGNAVIDVKQR